MERAFLMFGLAENDEQLQQLINSFLCPVILKMASKFESVRDKVINIIKQCYICLSFILYQYINTIYIIIIGIKCIRYIDDMIEFVVFFIQAMEILSHMNKQLQNRTKVLIPVTALLELLDENASVIKVWSTMTKLNRIVRLFFRILHLSI